jgi:threonine/homoserine/homoserine lactone efflux protein
LLSPSRRSPINHVPKFNKELLFMEFSNIWIFVLTAATLLIIPGPAVLYIMARSIEQGKKAGIVSVLGVFLVVLFTF